MLELRKSVPDEIKAILELESEEDVSAYIVRYTAEMHFEEMRKDDVVYLSIYARKIFSGFIILLVEDGGSIEFRRIAVRKRGDGIGQAALNMMEKYCREELNSKRVWLDVFQSNVRAQHIYTKMGFTQNGTGSYNGRELLYFEKQL